MSEWDGGGAFESVLRDCVIIGNTAVNGLGGGTCGCVLDNCRLMNNLSGDEGGGAYAPERVLDTVFCGNSPDSVSGDDATVVAGSAFVYTPEDSAIDYSVSYDWLVAQGLSTYGASSEDLAAKLSATQANGYTGWQSYVAGLASTNPASKFTATVTISNGLVSVGWSPNLNSASDTRIYTLYSVADLGNDNWVTPIMTWHRFFKVHVAMPTGAENEKTDVAGEGFVPTKFLGGVQLWPNGPYWAECNVGATKPEDPGYYFWWGDTVGYTNSGNAWVAVNGAKGNFSFSSWNCSTYMRNIETLQSFGCLDSENNLMAAYDAATSHSGEPWRMPTSDEIDALDVNCTSVWTNRNGVYGRLVTGKGDYASKSIFLPAAGYGDGANLCSFGTYGNVWSSTPNVDSAYAEYLGFLSSYFGRGSYGNRYSGQTVRPIREYSK